MQGNQQVINILNQLLIAENTAIMQYKYNCEFNKNNQYTEIGHIFKERMQDEQKHYHYLIARILFLEGLPVIDKVNGPKQAVDIKSQFENDLQLEMDCIKSYNDAIHKLTCGDEGIDPDNDTRRILEKILKEETEHCKEIEGVLKKIQDVGVAGFLSSYIK